MGLMSDFVVAWRLSRQRFDDEVLGLTAEQLNWRLYPNGLSIGEMALHVVGVEISFLSQLLGTALDADAVRVKRCATEGVVNEMPFPFYASLITPETVALWLKRGREIVEPVMAAPPSEVLEKEIVSALGPVITGEGALARLCFHPAYHQGQAYQMKGAEGFPSG